MLCRACRASFLFYLDLFGRICNHEFAFTCKCGCIIATTHNHTNGNTKDRSPYGKMTSQAERCLLTCLFRCNYAMARQELDLTGKLDCDLHKYLPMLMSKYPLRFHASCTGTHLCPSLLEQRPRMISACKRKRCALLNLRPMRGSSCNVSVPGPAQMLQHYGFVLHV